MTAPRSVEKRPALTFCTGISMWSNVIVDPSMVEKRVSFVFNEDAKMVESSCNREFRVLVVRLSRLMAFVQLWPPNDPIVSMYPCVTNDPLGLYVVMFRSTRFL